MLKQSEKNILGNFGNWFLVTCSLVYLQQVCLHLFVLDEEYNAEKDESNHNHTKSNYHWCTWLGKCQIPIMREKNGWGVLALIVPTGRHSQEYTPSYLWRDIWWDLISKRDMKGKRRYYLKPVLHSLNSSARHLDHWIIIWRFHGQAHRFIDNLLTFGCLMVMPPAHWLSFGCLMVKGHWFINNLLTFRRLMVKAHCLIDNGPTFGLLVFTCTSRMRSPTPCYTGPGIGPDHLGPCTWIQLS